MPDGDINLREGLQSVGKDAYIARLHEDAPLAKDVSGFWVANRFEDVRAILLDHARFSSGAMGGQGGGMRFPLLTDDPPRHSVLRGLLAKAFTPAAMEAMRPAIEQLARDLVAAIPAGEDVDIVEALTTPLPVAVIAGMMGVPAEKAGDFKRWSNAILGIQESPFDPDRIAKLMELRSYFQAIAAERRTSPGEDLVSALTRVRETPESLGETLTDDQVVGFCILLMIAGNETTTNLLGNLLNRLAGAPEGWAALRADPTRIESAIEESLRVDSPAQMVMRVASEDVTVSGRTIKKGEMVMIYLASANRDPGRWSDPADFELSREIGRHVAFGHGVHTCIGAPLARMEAKAAMDALVARFASLKRGSQPGQRLAGGGILFGFRSLSVVLS